MSNTPMPPPPPPGPGPGPGGYVPPGEVGGPLSASETRKQAKADAKAAEARAKSLRPWYKKKRYWLLAAIAVVVILIVATANSTKTKDTTLTGAVPATTGNGVSQGAASHDASADVTNPTLGPPDALGFRSVTVTVTNNSSKRSNYVIDVSVESPDGKTQYDTTTVFVNNLEPGQTAQSDGFPITKKVPDDAVVVIKGVQRFASP